jgi:hypothetical protein
MATEYATVGDVEALYGQPIPTARIPYVEALLRSAHARLYARVPAIDSRVSAGKVSADIVREVVIEMVLNVLRNPQGVTQMTTATGPVSSSMSFSAATSGRMILTDELLELLGEQGDSAYTVTLIDDGLIDPRTPYVPLW